MRRTVANQKPLILSSVAHFIVAFYAAVSIAAETDTNDAVETVSFENGTEIFVPATVNGQPSKFFINMTLPNTMLDNSHRDRLGPSLKKESLGPLALQAEFFATPSIRIGATRSDAFAGSETIPCVELLPGAAGFERASGAIGMDYLKHTVLRLDFDKKTAQIKSTANTADGFAERIQLMRGIPTILLHHPQEGFESFQLTLGDINVAVKPDVYTWLVQRRRIQEIPSRNSKGVATVRAGLLDCLELGPYRFSNQMVVMADNNYLGVRFLSRFNIEFDFPNRMAYFQPSAAIRSPSRYNRAGFGIATNSGRRFITVADVNAPGPRAGLVDRDELVAINGQPAIQLRVWQIIDMLCAPGAEMHLEIQRDGKMREFKFDLSNDPDPFPNLPLQSEADDDADVPKR